MDHVLELISNASPWQVHGVLFILILASGLCLFAEDLAVVAAGVLVSRGTIEFVPTVALCVIAVVVADSILFLLGRILGESALDRPFVRRLVSRHRFDWARRMAGRHSHRMVLAARFLPGFRAPLYFTYGALGITGRRFLLFDALAASIEVTLLVLAASWAGAQLGGAQSLLAGIELVVVGVVLAALSGVLLYLVVRRRRSSPTWPIWTSFPDKVLPDKVP